MAIIKNQKTRLKGKDFFVDLFFNTKKDLKIFHITHIYKQFLKKLSRKRPDFQNTKLWPRLFTPACNTSKRILDLEYRLHHCLSKFDRSVFLILKPISYFLAFKWLGFLSRNYWSLLDHDLMASNWEKAISILAGNLNSGRSYLITAVL